MKHFLTRLIPAIRYAFQGMKFAFQNEPAFRQECIVAFFATLLAFYLASDWRDVFYLMTPLIMAMAFELCNTALEQVVNVLSEGEIKTVFKNIKDCAAAAVCLMLCWSGMIWIVYLFHQLMM